jgi:hypothetical protein
MPKCGRCSDTEDAGNGMCPCGCHVAQFQEKPVQRTVQSSKAVYHYDDGDDDQEVNGMVDDPSDIAALQNRASQMCARCLDATLLKRVLGMFGGGAEDKTVGSLNESKKPYRDGAKVASHSERRGKKLMAFGAEERAVQKFAEQLSRECPAIPLDPNTVLRGFRAEKQRRPDLTADEYFGLRY